MSPADVLAVAAGVVLLGVVGIDVFSTVLHPWGRSGRLGRWIVHGAWRLALRLARPLRAPRKHRVLSLVGPALIPLVVAIWAALAVAGFALLYLPAMPESTARWEGLAPAGAFIDAFYLSGYTFFTLGFGDIVPTGPGLRLLTILQSGSGFAFITFVISYFFSVYGAFTHKTTLAESVYFQAGRSPDAATILAGHLATRGGEVILAAEVARLRDGLVRLRAQYSDYPILHFFRDERPEQSVLRLLFTTQELAALLDTVVDAEALPVAAGLGTRSGLAHATASTQRALVEDLVWQVRQELEEARSREEPPHGWVQDFDRSVDRLREAGVAVDDSEESRKTYLERRQSWEPMLRICARTLGLDWDRVVGERKGEEGRGAQN